MMKWTANRVAKYENIVDDYMNNRTTLNQKSLSYLAIKYEKIRLSLGSPADEFEPSNVIPLDQIEWKYREICKSAALIKRNYIIDSTIRKIAGSLGRPSAALADIGDYDISQGNPVLASLIDVIIGIWAAD